MVVILTRNGIDIYSFRTAQPTLKTITAVGYSESKLVRRGRRAHRLEKPVGCTPHH
jgi:hypothetical protein